MGSATTTTKTSRVKKTQADRRVKPAIRKLERGKLKRGLGIITFERPDYLAQSLASVVNLLSPQIDFLYVYRDGGGKKAEYKALMDQQPEFVHYIDNNKNHGVAHAKNVLLKKMMDDGCEFLFLLEDDIIVQSDKVLSHYIAARYMSGFHHLMFAHHGLENFEQMLKRDGVIEYYPSAVGAFTFFTREAIERGGYLDENFYNAYEHIEHMWRIYKAAKPGYTPLCPPLGYYPDIVGSKKLLKEIPYSVSAKNSSIRKNAEWMANIEKAKEYWRRKDPTCPV